MISIVITSKGLKGLPDKLNRFRVGVLARVSMMLAQAGEEIVSRSTEDYLSGPRPKKLGRVSGDLARSVVYKVQGNRVVIGSNLRYARIHEEGGVIVPKRAQALRFKIGNSWVTVNKVTIPDRPFLRPALKDGVQAVRGIIKRLSDEALREALA